MLSRRVPAESEPNAWAAALERRRAGENRLIDLTEQNPTRVGLGGASEQDLAALAHPAGMAYEPASQGAPAARGAVRDYYATRGIEVDVEDITLVSSTSEGYAHLFRLLCDPGDRVAFPAPSYPLLAPLADLEGIALDAYRWVLDGRWRADVDSLEATLGDRTRAVVLVQPNHPTGSCVSADELRAIVSLCERRNISIISDEVFGDFLWRDAGRPPGTDPSLLAASSPVPTFVLHGLSKLCGMPQLKLAWIACGGEARGRREARWGLGWIADTFLSVGTPVQLALPRLIEARHAFRERTLARVLDNRGRLERAADECGLRVLPADGGWSAVFRLDGPDGADRFALELLEHDVVVHPGHFYDFEDDSHLVVSLIVPPEDLERGMAAIAGVAARRR